MSWLCFAMVQVEPMGRQAIGVDQQLRRRFRGTIHLILCEIEYLPALCLFRGHASVLSCGVFSSINRDSGFSCLCHSDGESDAQPLARTMRAFVLASGNC